MRRVVLSKISLCSHGILSAPPQPRPTLRSFSRISLENAPSSFSLVRNLRFFSLEDGSSDAKTDQKQDPSPVTEGNGTENLEGEKGVDVAVAAKELEKPVKANDVIVQDVSNEELKARIEKYFKGQEEDELPAVLEAILSRRLAGKHEETDDELADEFRFQPVDDVTDQEFESDFEEVHQTDDEVENLYSARDIVVKRMREDPYFNMDDKKWDDMIQEAVQHGYLKDTKECEEILEDMLNWDNLLPDDMKQKVEAKFNELGDMCERQELQPEEAYEHFKEFEDKIVAEYLQQMEAEGPPQFDEEAERIKKVDSDDPPGEGPILTWQTRAVFAPGGDAWHPKNRKVKLSVTVKELGLSRYQFKRMRAIVGKRYHPGKDQLTITSERYEEREENRKDCLRTLLNIIEESGKANKLVDKARTCYVKERLKANPAFMARLQAKTTNMLGASSAFS